MNAKEGIFSVDVETILRDNTIQLASDNKNIMQKDTRPYYVSIKLDSKYSAFIPIRTNLTHNYGFITKTIPKHHMKSGLDFTKSLLVESKKINSYLVKEQGISLREYKKIQSSRGRIRKEYHEFIFTTFIPILNQKPSERTQKEQRLYNFSSLQYFTQSLKEIQKHRESKRSLKNDHSKKVNNTQPTQTKRPILEQIQQAEQKSVQKNQNKPSNRTTHRRDLEK